MTVAELIEKLERLPKTLQVFHADHDHGTFETSGGVRCAELIDKKLMTEFDNDKDCGRSDFFQHTPNRYVVLRS